VSLGKDTMIGGDVPRGMMMHGPDDSGDGLATGRQDGSTPQPKEPVRRWGGKSRLKHPQDWHSNVWQLHTLGLSWRWLALPQIMEHDCTMKWHFFPLQKGQKSVVS